MRKNHQAIMTTPGMENPLAKYEAFVSDVLKEDLKQVDLRLQRVKDEITDLIQQKRTLKVVTSKEMHPNGFKAQLNIGTDFHMEASVTNTSTVLIDIGLSYLLEFSIEEANKYLDLRLKAYEKIAEELKDQIAETKAHISLMLIGMAQLQYAQLGKPKKP